MHACVVLPQPVSPLTTATSACCRASSSGARIAATGSAPRCACHLRGAASPMSLPYSVCYSTTDVAVACADASNRDKGYDPSSLTANMGERENTTARLTMEQQALRLQTEGAAACVQWTRHWHRDPGVQLLASPFVPNGPAPAQMTIQLTFDGLQQYASMLHILTDARYAPSPRSVQRSLSTANAGIQSLGEVTGC